MIRDKQRFDALMHSTREFVEKVAIPNEERVEADDQIPEAVVEQMRELGLFGWSIPETYGGAGYCGDIALTIERFYRDVRLFRLYEGTSQIHQLNIARQLLRS